jgi:hypothetical protein
MIGINKGALAVVDPNLKLELKFNTTNYTDVGGTVAATTNDYVRAWKSTVNSHLFTQSTDSARPQRVSDGILFDGGDTLAIANTPTDFNFGTSPFTVEYWAYQATGAGALVAISPNSNSYAGFQIYDHALYMANTGGTAFAISGMSIGSLTANTWTHYAVSRDGSSVVRSYKNGVYVAQATLATAMHYLNSLPTNFGSNRGAYFWAGKLADFRIYTSCIYPSGTTFTPPTRSA